MLMVNGDGLTTSTRDALHRLFAGHRRDAITVEAVLTLGLGTVTYDRDRAPRRAGLTVNHWTLVAGQQEDPELTGCVQALPGHVFIPGPGSGWRI